MATGERFIAANLTGVEDVRAGFKRMTDTMRAETIKEALTPAAEPIVRAAKDRAPGVNIPPGIRLLGFEVERSGVVTAGIGLPGGRNRWFHGLFVELGTGPRIQKTTGRRTGSMPANPFLRPAFDEKKDEAWTIFMKELRGRLEATARG